MFLPKRKRRNLLEDLTLSAPYVTETRRLLQNLNRQQKGTPLEKRSYMVTSATKGEGKSTICALMAMVSARLFEKRTLLIDGDLHRPTVHSLVGVSRGPGLFEVMKGTVSVQAATHATALPRLWVIPSGYAREAIGESFNDAAFRRTLQELRAQYDAIFIDAPPAVPAIEPVLMADHVDSVVIVALAGRTPLALVRRSMQILAPVADKIAGIVLNDAVDGLPYHFNYGYYGYDQPRRPRARRADQRRTPERGGQKPRNGIGGTH